MRIVIDLQSAQVKGVFQEESILFAQALIRNKGDHEIVLVLSDLLPETIEIVRGRFDGLISQEYIRVWKAPGPICEKDSGNKTRRKIAELVREAFLANLEPDIVHVMNLFEGYSNNIVTSIGVFAQSLSTSVTLYDGLFQPKTNKQTAVAYQEFCIRKINQARRASLFLSLSAFAKQEGVERFNLKNETIIDISQGDKSDSVNFHEKWNIYAVNAIKAFEIQNARNLKENAVNTIPKYRPKLAYISPLPPEHTGIADYSAELLPELAQYYDIDVIVDQQTVSDVWVSASLPIRDIKWFRENSEKYDRVIYHLGNSPFHQYMFPHLKDIPGVIVLHDFFLSNLLEYLEVEGMISYIWKNSLYSSHGYKALKDLHRTDGTSNVIYDYPCNLSVLQNAQGVLAHSKTSFLMAKYWYGEYGRNQLKLIPPLAPIVSKIGRAKARLELGLPEHSFVVCSFGMLGPTKLNNRLLDAYLDSNLARQKNCKLIFIGESPGGEYEERLLRKKYSKKLSCHISITGRVDAATYRYYLEAADIGVQLRTQSRGEMSKAVLDCLSYGLPTIINAHGSMDDFPGDAVWKIPDKFHAGQLIEALEELWRDKQRRELLSDQARKYIEKHHDPSVCASKYVNAIEFFYKKSKSDIYSLINMIGKVQQVNAENLFELANDIALSIQPLPSQKQLFLDISALVQADIKTGIQRVVRSILNELLDAPPAGFRVEPVYATENMDYHYARTFTAEFLNISPDFLLDTPVEYQAGDIFFCIDLHFNIVIHHKEFYQQLRRFGVSVQFIVYDLLPLQFSEYFPEGTKNWFRRWLDVVLETDGAICISEAVANDLRVWIGGKEINEQQRRPFKISWYHNGADINASLPTMGLPNSVKDTLGQFKKRPTFLVVGTIEPRKGYLQVLDAFDQLWHEGLDANLVIVGSEGWKTLPNEQRRTIPKIVERLRSHPEQSKRLYWLDGISDEYLEKIYDTSTCLIMASEGEGFGLPLIEAAQHKLPIIVRDIPVFREVAGEHAFYFGGLDAEDLAQATKKWFELHKANQIPLSDRIPWLTWKESVARLMDILTEETA